MNVSRDYYAILGLTPDSTSEEIDKVFNELNASSLLSEEDKQIINEAHTVLSNPQKKNAYDERYRNMLAHPTPTNPWAIVRIILTVIAVFTFLASLIELTECRSYNETTYITQIVISLIFIVAVWCGKSLWSWFWGKTKPVAQKTIGNVSNFVKEATATQQKEVQDLKLKVAELEKEKLQREIDDLKTKLAAKEQEIHKK